MRAAVLAALAVCAAELAVTLVADAAPADTALHNMTDSEEVDQDGTAAPTWAPATPAPPTPAPVAAHIRSDRGWSSPTRFSTPQEWFISCTPYSTLWMHIRDTPSGYNLRLDGKVIHSASYHQVACPSSEVVSLLYTPYDGHSHIVRLQWYPATDAPSTWTPVTPAPPTPSPVTASPVHYLLDHDSVHNSYSTPQEWLISCTAFSTILMDFTSTPSGYSLTVDGRSMSSGSNQRVTCPSSRKMSLRYTPQDGQSHTLMFAWHTSTAAPSTSIPATSVPSPVTVHYMSDHDSVYSYYSTPQEWRISCTPYSSLWMDITYTPSGYVVKVDGRRLNDGSNQRAACPSSGEVSLLYTPQDRERHTLRFKWSPVPTQVHHMSREDSVSRFYSTPQEWVISCTPHGDMYVTVTQLPGALKADMKTLYRGQRKVDCPSTGQVRLSYIPSSFSSQPLIVSWAPEGGGDESQGLSPPLIAVIATVGVLVLVGVTVAAYCGCRGQAADRKADSSSVRCQEYDNVALRCVPPSEGKQPVSEMEEQLLLVDRRL